MRITLPALAALLLLAVAPASASPRGRASMTPLETVRGAKRFTIGRVGFAAVRSKEELAFRALLRDPGAAGRFEALVSSATPAGRLYGLLGLKLAGAPAYKAALAELSADDTPVGTMTGCLASTKPTGQLAKKVAAGDYDKDPEAPPPGSKK